jgi:hypothetical protein
MKRSEDEARRPAALMVLFFVLATPVLAAPSGSGTNSPAVLQDMMTLDPHSGANLETLARLGDGEGKKEKKEAKAQKKQARDAKDLKDLSAAELRKLFMDESSKYESREVSAIGRLAHEALRAKDATTRAAHEADIREVQAAMRNEGLPLVPAKLGVITTWVFFFKNLSGTIGRGHTMAADLGGPANLGDDAGRADPLPSSFWTRPTAISRENVYAGFGRDKYPRLEQFVCDYSAPKTSSGTHAGFDVACDGRRYKIKFGEVNSEPFTARIFHALGYHVDPTDYAPEIRLHYDRRMFREFHLRKPLTMKITPLGVHLGTVQLQTHYDPFNFINTAVFRDGRRIPGAALKQMIFKNPTLPHPEDSPANFRPEVEAAVDYLVMAPANIQPRDGPTQSIGSWEFGGLGHENRRELRGAGLLAAWLAWFDSRGDNTKLRLERDTGEVRLEHFISDLGGGLGAGTGLFSPRGENPNDFTWTFTAPEIIRGPGRMTTPFRIEHFRPTVPTPAFAAMTLADARWMARLIGQLTENQLRGALIAAGYDNAEATLYLEKLISRRDRMICDLKLQNEIPLLRPNGQNRHFNYIPGPDNRFAAASPSGATIFARDSGRSILHGQLVPASPAPSSSLLSQ